MLYTYLICKLRQGSRHYIIADNTHNEIMRRTVVSLKILAVGIAVILLCAVALVQGTARAEELDKPLQVVAVAEGKTPVHPYLAHQMLDFGFRQTLEVQTLGCARRSLPYQLTSRGLVKI